MKNKLVILALMVLATTAFAQTTNIFINGTLDIRFHTRTKTGPTDKYTMNINVCDSAVFRGTIDAKPFVGGTFSDENGTLTYAIDCFVVNPKLQTVFAKAFAENGDAAMQNATHVKNVGKIYGTVPVDKNNVYRFQDGSVKMGVLGASSAKGLDSKFTGLALGRPPANQGLWAKAKQEALSIQRKVKGKTVGLKVSKYDKMTFDNHGVAAGPVQIYPEATVNGVWLYDYARYAWFFQDVTVRIDGRVDKLSGNIRWVEAPNRKVSGEGQYEFDIRFNEPPPSEADAFAAPQDEASFFETDSTISSLTGIMTYKDTMSGDVVAASSVKVALVGNQMTKQQAMYMFKQLFLSAIVPLNAE